MISSITKNKDFRELQEGRAKHVDSCKENNDHSHRMLAEEIYSKQTRFVYELLQNADDAGAKKASFQITESQLLLRHNGKNFSFSDIESITTFGQSTKLSEEGQIGKFGVGFKSVHSVTETPYIHSGPFHFKIKDYIVPCEVAPDEMSNMNESETLIILPFNHSQSTSEKSHALTLRQLEELNTECLLFLRNIEEISWESENNRQKRYRRVSEGDYIILERGGDANIRRYLVCKKDISIDDHSHTVNIAYLVDTDTNGNKAITPVEENIFVFFPTNTSSKLKFLVQAPYKTTLNRESIDFDDEENYQLTEGLANLAGETLVELKERGLLTPNFFLKILPTHAASTESKEPCDVIAHKSTEILKKEALLPASGDIEHVKAENALLPLSEELMNCLKPQDISDVFGRNCWLSSELKGIRNFLTSIGVEDVSIDSFLGTLQEHKKFIEGKDDEWLINLYCELENYIENHGSGESKERVGRAAIVRLIDGRIIAPWGEDKKPQVYLPYSDGRESKFPTVSKYLAASPKAKGLFKILDLHEPDELAEIKQNIIPKYRKEELDIDFSAYRKDIEHIRKAFINSNHDKQSEIKDILGKINIVRTQCCAYVAPADNEVYIQTDDIKAWFEGNQKVYVVDENILNVAKSEEETISLFERLGCKRIDGIAKNFNEYRVDKYYDHRIGEEGFNPEFDIAGLEHAVENINLQRSQILWSQLLKHYKHVKGRVRRSSNKTSLHEAQPTEENSKAGKFLATRAWLYDKQKSLINPNEYDQKTIDDLHDSYRENERADSLAKSLGLSPKFISHEDLEKRVQIARQEEAEKWKKENASLNAKCLELEAENLKLRKEAKNGNGWLPEYSPGQGRLDEVERKIAVSQDGGNGRGAKEEMSSKEVGRWGEEDVYLLLKDQGDDVEWINKLSEAGESYDIVIKAHGSIKTYIEVKSTRNAFPNAFNFTKREWDFAKKKGDNYHVYFVSKVGTKKREYVIVENPAAEKKAGTLNVETVTRRIYIKKAN